MKQQNLFEAIPCDKFDLLTKEEIKTLALAYQDVIRQMQKTIEKQNAELCKSEQTRFLLDEQVINIKHKIFGKRQGL